MKNAKYSGIKAILVDFDRGFLNEAQLAAWFALYEQIALQKIEIGY